MMILSVRNSTTLHLLHKVRQINKVVAGSFFHSVNMPVFANMPVFVDASINKRNFYRGAERGDVEFI